MSKKIVWGIVGVVVLVGVFYMGVSYGKGQTSSSSGAGGQAFTYGGARGTRGTGGFGGATIGQIISKDATSITVQLAAGGPNSTSQAGSKIVFVDNNTKITKSVSGTLSDLAVGTNVSVTGTADSDGSISAQSVQIRPNMPTTAPAPSTTQ